MVTQARVEKQPGANTHIAARLPNVKRPVADGQKHVGKVRRPLQRHGRRVVALDKLLDRLARPGGLVVVRLLARAPVAKDELALLGRHQETGRVADRDSDLAVWKANRGCEYTHRWIGTRKK